MNMNISRKAVFCSGNVSNGQITYECYPNNEFSQGKWILAVNSVTFDTPLPLSSTCMITCNFVTSKKRTAEGDVKIFEQPPNVFFLKTTTTSPRGVSRFCKYYLHFYS